MYIKIYICDMGSHYCYSYLNYYIKMWISVISLIIFYFYSVDGIQNMRSDPQILVEGETAVITCINPSGGINKVTNGDYILPGCLGSSCSFYTLTSTRNKWTVHIENVRKIRDAGVWTCDGQLLQTSLIVNVVPKGEFLLVTEVALRTIYKVDVVTESFTDMKFGQKEYPVALSFDPTTSKVYWSENKARLLKAADTSGNQMEVVTGTDFGAIVDGMAVDFIHRLLYYTVEMLDTINVLHLDNYDYKMTLIDTGLGNPRGIALLPNEGIMFWTDWGSKPGIEVANMDGSDRNTFLSFPNGSWPNGLTVDTKTRTLFWIDAKFNTINAISLDKTNRKTLYRSINAHFYDIVIMGKYLYVSDWSLRYLRRLTVTGNDMELFGLPVLMRSYGIYAYNSSEVLYGSSICQDAKCHHLCLPRKQRLYTCGCKNGFILASDKFSCKKEVKFRSIKPSLAIHNITEGTHLEMVCEFNNSAPTSSLYTWRKNGIRITTERSKLLEKTTITSDDSGNYSCSNGNQKETIQLNVIYPPKVQSPYSTIDIIESSTLVINCNATANPNISSFLWTGPNDEQLTGKDNAAMTSTELTIPLIDRSKSGKYICTALNTMSESMAPKYPITTRSTSMITVNVLYVPLKDETYENQTIRASADASLSCSIDSNPPPSSYKWYHPDGTLVSRNSKLEGQVIQKGVYRCSVEIKMQPTVGNLVTKTHTKIINVIIVDSSDSDSSTMIISLAVCIPLLVLVTAVVVAVICYRKRGASCQRSKRTPLTNDERPHVAIVESDYSSLNRHANSDPCYDNLAVKYHVGSENDAAYENQRNFETC